MFFDILDPLQCYTVVCVPHLHFLSFLIASSLLPSDSGLFEQSLVKSKKLNCWCFDFSGTFGTSHLA